MALKYFISSFYLGSRDEFGPTATKLARHTYRSDGYRRGLSHDSNVCSLIDTASIRRSVGLVLGLG